MIGKVAGRLGWVFSEPEVEILDQHVERPSNINNCSISGVGLINIATPDTTLLQHLNFMFHVRRVIWGVRSWKTLTTAAAFLFMFFFA